MPGDDPGSDSPRWSEPLLEALDHDEYDFQEFKGSLWLSRDREIQSAFQHMLSKQVSAFANGGGGRLIIGLDDDGCIDGGVPVDLKGGGTRSWLEDVIPTSVSPSLRRFNVFEVRGQGSRSAILPGHAVYVVEIPASEDAPHQAHDHRYYLRIAGKSRPMGHIHVEDVLRRTRHPQVRLGRLSPFGEPELIETDPRGPKVLLCFRAFIVNEGRTLAHHVGVEIRLPRPLVNSEVRARMTGGGRLTLTQDPGALTFFHYHPTPLFPGQTVQMLSIWVALHGSNQALVRSDEAAIHWRVYADDALPVEGSNPLGQFRVVRRVMTTLARRGAVAGGAPVPRKRRRKGRPRVARVPASDE